MLDAFGEYHGKSISLLCSGGLDSRLVAAYAVEGHANTRMVYTLGDPGTMIIAAPAARSAN